MKSVVLSICLAIYNQIDIVRANIEEIVKYKGDDIEIIVSDDCSTEPIKEMLLEFNDSRIKYCKTEINKSHDNNIINAFRNCSGEYAFLFRSKDVIVSTEIKNVIDIIKKHKNASYFLFSALEDDRTKGKVLEDKVYKGLEQTQQAHSELLVHPSGQIYKLSCLQLDLYEEYIDKYFPKYNGCVVHQLIRMDLATKGDFVTSSCFAWLYANTLNSKSKSVIVTDKKENINSPYYSYQRYECELNFAANEIDDKIKKRYLEQIIHDYCWRVSVIFWQINNNEKFHQHYNSEKVKFSPFKELKVFKRKSLEIIGEIDYEDKQHLEQHLMNEINKLRFDLLPKLMIGKYFFASKTLTKIWNVLHGRK